MKARKGKGLFVFCCLAPAAILFIVFMILPTIDIFRMSMFKWGGYTDNKTFVGLDNFKILFKSDKFYQAFQNSILLIVLVTLVTFTFALVFAYILSREKIKGKTFFSVIFYIPNILSVVVISAIFSAIYDPNLGLLNSFLNLFKGAENPTLWLGDQKIVIYSIVIALVWQAIGYYMVMYMASMANVPESLYESAALEGAGKIRQFFTITIPLIWTNIRTTLTFFVISTINMSFLLVKAMTNGGPDGASNVFLSYMYQDLDKHQNNTYILRYQYDQYEFPACKSNDKRRTGRSVKCILKLYVSGSVHELFLWIWYGDRCYGIPLLVCTCGNSECGNKTSGNRILREGDQDGKNKSKRVKKTIDTFKSGSIYLINSPCDHNYHSGRLGICCIC